jgi:hypothetical protein
MTVTPAEVSYSLPTDVDTSSPLVNPSHSQLHNDVNRAALDLSNRLNHVEQILAGLTAPDGTIQQARLVAHQWFVRGPLSVEMTHTILIPLIWNITGRPSTFNAVKATVLTPADADITVNLVIGSQLSGPHHDHDGDTQTEILKQKLVIPAGEHYSATIGPDDFVGDHPIETYIAAFIDTVGSPDAPGADLSIQLNRSL